MSWASLVKGDIKKEKIKTKSTENKNYKKLNTLSFCKKEKKLEVDDISEKDEIKINLNTINLDNTMDHNLIDDFTDNLYNNYQQYIFNEYNQLDYINCCNTYQFFMNYSKPILINSVDNDLNYNSESDYYSE